MTMTNNTSTFQPSQGPGRCTSCGWHIPTQGHNPQCIGGTQIAAAGTPVATEPGCRKRPPPKPAAPDVAADIAAARADALQHQQPRDQVNAYWSHPRSRIPAVPNRSERAGDFIGHILHQNTVIQLILDGIPASVFDWSDPPTPESLRHNSTAAARWEAIKPPPRPRNRAADPAVDGISEYGLAALRAECSTMFSTQPGARNEQLNRSAFNLGQLIASGDLPEDVVARELCAAAEATGLPDREIRATLRSGLTKGKQTPRAGGR